MYKTIQTIVLILAICCMTTNASALSLKDLPTTKTGITYDVEERDFAQAYSVQVLTYKNLVSLDVGYTSREVGFVAPTLNIGNLGALLGKYGLSVPLAKYVDISVGYFVGGRRVFDREVEFRHGVIVNAVELKF